MKEKLSRRDFLKRTAVAAVSVPLVVRSFALGLAKSTAPSARITMGCIGTNNMGLSDMRGFLKFGDVQIVAVCDVDIAHCKRAKNEVEEHYESAVVKANYGSCAAYNDFRDLLERDDIDTVLIATPDHWHVPISIAAARAGKDIYCEKPLSKTIAEGRTLCNIIKQYNRVFQAGTQLRSGQAARFACELVRNGRIGRLHTIRTCVPTGRAIAPQATMPVPDGLDYDLWLGPAPWAPYTKRRCHGSFRYISDYAGGVMTDLGAHDNDLAQWGNDTEHTGPVEIEGTGRFPRDGLWDTATSFEVHYTYENGVKLVCATRDIAKMDQGIRFEGTNGWVMARSYIDAEPKSLLNSRIGADEVHLYQSDDHHRNFIDCVKTRRDTIAPPEVAHRSVTICHLGNIALKLGRKLRWDPGNERFVNDSEANQMLSRAMRSPWQL